MTIGIVEFFQSLQNGFFDFFFNAISFLGEEYVYIVILGTVYYIYDKKLGEYLAFTIFFTGILNNTLKVIFNAPRPFEKYPNRVENLRPSTSSGNSFPSGHTQMFTAFLFAGSFKLKNTGWIVAASVLSALMAISRMYLGVHFLEDVLTSIILGIITAYILSKFFYKLSDSQLTKVYTIILIVFLPFLILLGEEDLFKTYGLMGGFLLAMLYEKKYVNFTLEVSRAKKIIRVFTGLVIMMTIQIGLGAMFDTVAEEGTTLLNILDMARYGLISFVGLGLYPTLFKKFNF